MKIKNIFIKNGDEKIFLDENKNNFSELIDEKFLNEKDLIELNVEIKLIPFGKFKFEENENINKKNEEKIKPRYIDQSGNIFFLLKGNKIK
jgi:hypothetical protein